MRGYFCEVCQTSDYKINQEWFNMLKYGRHDHALITYKTDSITEISSNKDFQQASEELMFSEKYSLNKILFLKLLILKASSTYVCQLRFYL